MIPAWFVHWLRSWGGYRRRAPADRAAVFATRYPDLAVAIITVADARSRRDTRGLHAATERARQARTAALMRELGR